jgi:ferredoxin
VCPRNAIEVTSVIKEQVLTVKIEHDNCSMCLKCIDNNGEFCPNNLFSEEAVEKDDEYYKQIKFNFSEVEKCQGCLRCELSCPENAIKPVTFKA